MRLLGEVERHLRATGLSPTRFGQMVARDPRLVFDLRRGREPRARLRTQILLATGHAGQPDARP